MTHPHVNDVALVGRLSGGVEQRPLPSGDTVVEWRLVVKRPPDTRRRQSADTIQCVSYDERFRERIADWRHGDLIEVRGSIRRRFYRTESGAHGSRYAVEVWDAELLAVAP